jgi:hypothetical protein
MQRGRVLATDRSLPAEAMDLKTVREPHGAILLGYGRQG